MSLTKELINQETLMAQGGERGVIHLHREGSFYRAYEWSAYLSCHYLHEFKVNKRAFKNQEGQVFDSPCNNIIVSRLSIKLKTGFCYAKDSAKFGDSIRFLNKFKFLKLFTQLSI